MDDRTIHIHFVAITCNTEAINPYIKTYTYFNTAYTIYYEKVNKNALNYT